MVRPCDPIVLLGRVPCRVLVALASADVGVPLPLVVRAGTPRPEVDLPRKIHFPRAFPARVVLHGDRVDGATRSSGARTMIRALARPTERSRSSAEDPLQALEAAPEGLSGAHLGCAGAQLGDMAVSAGDDLPRKIVCRSLARAGTGRGGAGATVGRPGRDLHSPGSSANMSVSTREVRVITRVAGPTSTGEVDGGVRKERPRPDRPSRASVGATPMRSGRNPTPWQRSSRSTRKPVARSSGA